MRVSPTYLINIFNLFDQLCKYLFRDTKLNCLLFCGLCSQLCQSLSVSCILCGIMWLPAFQYIPHLSSLCFKSAILLLCWKISAYLWTHRSTITSFADSVRSYRELVASSSVTMISTRVIAVFYMPWSFEWFHSCFGVLLLQVLRVKPRQNEINVILPSSQVFENHSEWRCPWMNEFIKVSFHLLPLWTVASFI